MSYSCFLLLSSMVFKRDYFTSKGIIGPKNCIIWWEKGRVDSHIEVPPCAKAMLLICRWRYLNFTLLRQAILWPLPRPCLMLTPSHPGSYSDVLHFLFQDHFQIDLLDTTLTTRSQLFSQQGSLSSLGDVHCSLCMQCMT